ncbi:hypothetical protein CCHL11_08949 [Colletotrichum chlorophyti]|uniref:Uncharacterized protein n=1 Tax=Colletotrichum chlorophyti TaxID=708187 RepID=A0A1Q8RS52_9PEZI|nr:hypothetical protein CCHL11_08949 [Colletotrichum chlorophyti]
MPRTRRSYTSSSSRSPSPARSLSRSRSRSRSSSAGPQRRRRPGLKTTAVFIAALAVATICIHKFWRRGGNVHSEKRQYWDRSPSPSGRRSRRRNVVRDRHNGYLEYHRPPPSRREQRRQTRSGPRSRSYDDSESETISYVSGYLPSPRERERRERFDADHRGRSRGPAPDQESASGFSGGRDEVVRYEKQSNRSEADKSRIEDDRSRRQGYGDVLDDWHRRGQRNASPSYERGYRPETVFDDRRSRRRSRVEGGYDYY